MMRPDGSLRIESTKMISPDVMSAKLAGAYKGNVLAVRTDKGYFLIAPEKLGGTRQVPADSLVDCTNYEVGEIGKELGRKKKVKTKTSMKGRVSECGK